MPRDRDQVTIAETSAEAGQVVGDRASALQLARTEMLLGDRKEQVPRLRGLSPFLVEQPLTARQPPCRGARLATQEEQEADPECAASSTRSVARVPVRPVSPPERALELLLASDEKCRDRQPLEIPRAQGTVAIGQGQELVRVLPRAAVVRAPAAIEGLPPHVRSMNGSAPRSRDAAGRTATATAQGFTASDGLTTFGRCRQAIAHDDLVMNVVSTDQGHGRRTYDQRPIALPPPQILNQAPYGTMRRPVNRRR